MNNPVLLACYELGHQPLSLAWPKAMLNQASIDTHVFDLYIEEFPQKEIEKAKFVGIATPMHTALRLGIQTAQMIRQVNPNAHICFYGMYAWLNRAYLLDSYADSIIGGEYDQALVELIKNIQADQSGENIEGVTTNTIISNPILSRLHFPIPDRTTLPPLEEYSHYTENDTHFFAGYVESSRGCLHTCKHCPVVPVYDGRFFIVPAETVLADIRQQIHAGAKHITFGDPDFLNGPKHALFITKELHKEFPGVTFDFTAKVEHILEHQHLMEKFRSYGCTFVISAFEATNDYVLKKLDKGHSVEDMEKALEILRTARISPQTTWMPFTPWTTLEDYIDLLQWIREQNLIQQVPVVQLSVRMLLPPGSKLIEQEKDSTWLGELNRENLSYDWFHPDDRMEELYKKVVAIAEEYSDKDAYLAFRKVEEAAFEIASEPPPLWSSPIPVPPTPPRLTEHWFC